MNKTDYSKMGKRNRLKGLEFEKEVRKNLKQEGWIVTKWQNNINLETNKLIVAKPGKYKLMQTGFPDFMAYKILDILENDKPIYDITFIEVRSNGYLKPEEKLKAQWYLNKKYCSNFYVASKSKLKGKNTIIMTEIKKEK